MEYQAALHVHHVRCLLMGVLLRLNPGANLDHQMGFQFHPDRLNRIALDLVPHRFNVLHPNVLSAVLYR